MAQSKHQSEVLLWACGLMFAGWDVNRKFCRPDPRLSAFTGRFILNSIKSAPNLQQTQTVLFLAAQAHSWFCSWSLWGMKGCIFRCSRGMSWNLIGSSPTIHGWLLSQNATAWSLFLPFPMTLFIIYTNTQVLIYQDIVHHSMTQLLFRFSISQTASPKELIQSQGLFTGNHECVKPSRCLLLLLLSKPIALLVACPSPGHQITAAYSPGCRVGHPFIQNSLCFLVKCFSISVWNWSHHFVGIEILYLSAKGILQTAKLTDSEFGLGNCW